MPKAQPQASLRPPMLPVYSQETFTIVSRLAIGLSLRLAAGTAAVNRRQVLLKGWVTGGVMHRESQLFLGLRTASSAQVDHAQSIGEGWIIGLQVARLAG